MEYLFMIFLKIAISIILLFEIQNDYINVDPLFVLVKTICLHSQQPYFPWKI